mgnify:CR=1 FL=1
MHTHPAITLRQALASGRIVRAPGAYGGHTLAGDARQRGLQRVLRAAAAYERVRPIPAPPMAHQI